MHLSVYFLPIVLILAWLIGVYQTTAKLINYINDSFLRLLGIDLSTAFDSYYYLAFVMAVLAIFFAIKLSLKHGWSTFIFRLFGFFIVGQLCFLFLVLTILLSFYWGGIFLEKTQLIQLLYVNSRRGEASWTGFYSLLISLFVFQPLMTLFISAFSECSQMIQNIADSNELDFSFSSIPLSLGKNETWYGTIYSIMIISICCVVIEHHFGEYAFQFFNISVAGLIILFSLVIVVLLFVAVAIVNNVKSELFLDKLFYCLFIAIQIVAALLVGSVFVFLLVQVVVNVWFVLLNTIIHSSFLYFVFPLLFFWVNIYFIFILILASFKHAKLCLCSLKSY